MPQNEAGIIEWTASKAMGSCTKNLAVEQVQYASVVVQEAGKFTMFCRSRAHGLLPGQSIEVEKRRAEREQTMQAGNRVCAYCVQLHVGCSYMHCPRCTWSVSHIFPHGRKSSIMQVGCDNNTEDLACLPCQGNHHQRV